MNASRMIDMQEVTRLTREGRLAEAMALLQGGPSRSADKAGGERGRTPSSDILDLEAPTTPGGFWTSRGSPPQLGATRAPASSMNQRGVSDKALRPTFGQGVMGIRKTAARPAPLANGARFEDRTHADRAGTRTYKLYVPSGFRGQALPLVVMLHGCTQGPDDFAAGTRMNLLAEEQLFLVAYPAQPQSANPQKCWNWFNAADQKRDQGEPALIAGITRQIIREFSVDAERVFIAGLSAGGAAAAIMGSAYPDLYAAIGVHSGLACGAANDMPSAFAAMRYGSKGEGASRRARRTVPTIVFHGDRDTTVSAINGDQVIAQSRAGARLGVSVSTGVADGGVAYTRIIHADDQERPVLEQWVLHGAGHAWSGGSPAGSYTEPRGPDASREMARFFLQNPIKR